MPSSAANPSTYSRRIKWLGIGAAIVAALYSTLWFWGAAKAKEELGKALADTARSGRTADCGNLDIRGFPFRIGVFCDRLTYSDPSESLSVTTGALRSAAQIYDPMQGIVELDGPFELSLPGNNRIKADWTLLHASARVSKPLPKRSSLEIKDIAVSMPSKSSAVIFKSDNLQAHFRTADNDIDLAASALNMLVGPALAQGRTIPAFNFDADIHIKDGVALAVSGDRDLVTLLRGQSGVLRGVGFNFAQGGGFTLSGPVALDEKGLVNADLSIRFSEAKKLGETIEKIAPEIAAYVAPSLSFAASAAKPGEDPKIDVTIRSGKASIGIIPLGQIPALN